MKSYTREFENKYLLKGVSFDEVQLHLGEYLAFEMSEPGLSNDTYWETPETSKYESVRVREDSAGRLTVTTKRKDRGTQEDRSELEMELEGGDAKYAIRLFTAILGTKPVGEVRKEYILFHPKPGGRDCVSVERVVHTNEVLVEVEGVDRNSLDRLAQEVETGLSELKNCSFEKVDWSIYSHYVQGKTT